MYFKKCFIGNFICCPIKIKAKKVGVYVQWASKPLTIFHPVQYSADTNLLQKVEENSSFKQSR